MALRGRQTMDNARGLTVRARSGACREELLVDAEEGATLILGLASPKASLNPYGDLKA